MLRSKSCRHQQFHGLIIQLQNCQQEKKVNKHFFAEIVIAVHTHTLMMHTHTHIHKKKELNTHTVLVFARVSYFYFVIDYMLHVSLHPLQNESMLKVSKADCFIYRLKLSLDSNNFWSKASFSTGISRTTRDRSKMFTFALFSVRIFK